MSKEFRFLVGGEWISSEDKFEIHQPYNDEPFATIAIVGHAHIEEALRKAYMAFEKTRVLSSFVRSKILIDIGNKIIKRKNDFIQAIINESGKTLREAKEELSRTVYTFRAASDAALTIESSTYPADTAREGEGVLAFCRRFPAGPVLAMSAFNYPLYSIAQKVAPAIASGNPFIICPAIETPVSALLLGEIMATTNYPKEAVSVLPANEEDQKLLIESNQIKVISFSGGKEAGWRIKELSGRKKVSLHMNGLGVAIVNDDANLEHAAECCIIGAFKNAGQIDSSLQRILVHEDVFYQFLGKFIKKTNMLKVGDPHLADTDVGPVIDEGAAARIERWIKDAVEQGADLVAGGSRDGALIQPTVFLEATGDMLICREEVFGPVVAVEPFYDIDQALWTVHDMNDGLQSTIFTNNLSLAMRVYNFLEVGSVLVNEVPIFRAETLPYGGVKDSSFGRESVNESINLMTEEKMLLINTKV